MSKYQFSGLKYTFNFYEISIRDIVTGEKKVWWKRVKKSGFGFALIPRVADQDEKTPFDFGKSKIPWYNFKQGKINKYRRAVCVGGRWKNYSVRRYVSVKHLTQETDLQVTED